MNIILKIIVEVICWIAVFSFCIPQGKEKTCVGEELFEAILHLPIRTFGIWVLFGSVFAARLFFGLPIAMIIFCILCIQVFLAIAFLRKGCNSRA